jgi:hypothetical protein
MDCAYVHGCTSQQSGPPSDLRTPLRPELASVETWLGTMERDAAVDLLAPNTNRDSYLRYLRGPARLYASISIEFTLQPDSRLLTFAQS